MFKMTDITTASSQGPRSYQEDRFLVADNLVAVSDGIGGHLNGDLAAQAIVDALQTIDEASPESVSKTLSSVNAEICKEGDRRGATVVVAYLEEKNLHVDWCGDSRAYLWRKSTGLTCLTKDHGYGSALLRCIGLLPYRGEHLEVEVEKGDIVILTTDGVHDYIDTVSTPLREAQEQMKPIANEIVDWSLKSGTRDNSTAVAFEIS